MQTCPGCNAPAVRLIKEWQTLTLKYVHAGFDCVLPMKPGASASEIGVELSKVRAELLKEKTLRLKRERQLQTIVSYATGQIYLEEIEEYVEENAGTGGTVNSAAVYSNAGNGDDIPSAGQDCCIGVIEAACSAVTSGLADQRAADRAAGKE